MRSLYSNQTQTQKAPFDRGRQPDAAQTLVEPCRGVANHEKDALDQGHAGQE